LLRRWRRKTERLLHIGEGLLSLEGVRRGLSDLPKRIAFKSLRQLGFEVRRSRKHPSLIGFIESRGVGIVYDVGANVGQFGLALRNRGYRGRIVSFEPVSSAFAVLQRIAAEDGNWQARQCAIGAEPGEAIIHVSANTQFSSIRNLSKDAASIDPDSGIVGSEKVACLTLDGIVGAGDGAPYLIKIDTQGFEREVLRGARRALSQAAGVLMELPIIDIYDGGWTFSEAVSHIGEFGFIPCQIDPVNHHHVDPMAAIEFDCLFRRRNDRID
jgi:FkbM family methyltransferase